MEDHKKHQLLCENLFFVYEATCEKDSEYCSKNAIKFTSMVKVCGDRVFAGTEMLEIE